MRTQTTQLDASHCNTSAYELDAYEALLLDVVENDHSLFLRYDEFRWAWALVDRVLEVRATEGDFIHTYQAGSWGPSQDNRLFDTDDMHWRNSLYEE